MQDFPIMREGMTLAQAGQNDDFFLTLRDYLTRLDIDTTMLSRFDFSAADVVLITSVPGFHSGGKLHQYGHMKLRRALETHLPPQSAVGDLWCQASSLGAPQAGWLSQLAKSLYSQQPGGITGDSYGMPATRARVTTASRF